MIKTDTTTRINHRSNLYKTIRYLDSICPKQASPFSKDAPTSISSLKSKIPFEATSIFDIIRESK